MPLKDIYISVSLGPAHVLLSVLLTYFQSFLIAKDKCQVPLSA